MITCEQAEGIVSRVVSAKPSDGLQGWKLVEFDAGWLIREEAAL